MKVRSRLAASLPLGCSAYLHGNDFARVSVNPLTLGVVGGSVASRSMEVASAHRGLQIDNLSVNRPNSLKLFPATRILADDHVAGFQVW